MSEFRKLASIQKIDHVKAVENSDFLDVVTIQGWKVVTKRGDFKVGDVCVYCEIDSVLPEREPFMFLKEKGFRIRTIKLKCQISQGICFPLNRQVLDGCDLFKNEPIVYNIGDDVTNIIGVKKYEPQIPANLSGEVKGNFPCWITKTDEIRLQSVPEYLELYKDTPFYVTQKIDGSSCTIYLRNGEFGVCSRNLELKETEGNAFWRTVRQLDIENKLRKYGKNIVLQGELYGSGIQKNKEGISGTNIAFFTVSDLDTGIPYPYQQFVDCINELQLVTVPIIHTNFKLLSTIDEMLALAEGKSVWNPNSEREGLVFRPMENALDATTNHRISFKVISNRYLLKNNE